MPDRPASRGLLTFGLLVALGNSACPAADPPLAPRPNVLLITFDTLRADHLGAYGYPESVSPAFDALAARGVLYERGIAASSRTAPSHASIMTSRHVRDHSIGHRNGATRLGDEETLARVLAREGYATAGFVGNTMLRRRIGLDSGFVDFDDELPQRELTRPVYERLARETTDRALHWLVGRDAAPWFLWVHYNDPHGPYTPASNFKGMFTGVAPTSLRVNEGALPPLDQQRGWHGLPAYQVLGTLRLPRDYRALYASEIRSVDASLGRLLLRAEEATGDSGLVILATADHGESLGESGFFFSHGHATTPDLVHVPFVLVAPGVSPGRSRELVHHVDVMPTILELIHVDAPADSAGLPLARHWRSAEPLPERVVFADVGDEVSAYQGDHFVRARLEDDLGDTREGSRTTYHWGADGSWIEVADDPQLRDRAEVYARRTAPLRWAPKSSNLDQERLRALGYIEPSRDEPAPDAR